MVGIKIHRKSTAGRWKWGYWSSHTEPATLQSNQRYRSAKLDGPVQALVESVWKSQLPERVNQRLLGVEGVMQECWGYPSNLAEIVSSDRCFHSLGDFKSPLCSLGGVNKVISTGHADKVSPRAQRFAIFFLPFPFYASVSNNWVWPAVFTLRNQGSGFLWMFLHSSPNSTLPGCENPSERRGASSCSCLWL